MTEISVSGSKGKAHCDDIYWVELEATSNLLVAPHSHIKENPILKGYSLFSMLGSILYLKCLQNCQNNDSQPSKPSYLWGREREREREGEGEVGGREGEVFQQLLWMYKWDFYHFESSKYPEDSQLLCYNSHSR